MGVTVGRGLPRVGGYTVTKGLTRVGEFWQH